MAQQEDPEHEPVRHRWSESERFVPRAFVRPAQRFMQVESAGAVVMLAAALVALVWANSPFADDYEAVWETVFELRLGELVGLDLSLREWVNDGAMALFFLVVGLEIKRELVGGELADARVAALPALAALGGMVVPAVVYLAVSVGEGGRGWGVPMATDIAFAVGVVSLLGPRVPPAAKLFLLTLAIVDDLGAIVVIAVAYTGDQLGVPWLGVAGLAVGAAVVLRRGHVRSLVPYAVLGVICWYALHEAGVHATLAGALFGFLTPAWSFYDPTRFPSRARQLVDAIEQRFDDDLYEQGEYERTEVALSDIARLAAESESPLDRIVDRLNPWVSFVIVPVFALANAGVAVSGDALGGAFDDPVLLGVAVGLVVGKPLGVLGATWLAVRLGIGRLPTGTTWSQLTGIAICAGIGFTVALFFADLAFASDAPGLASAKLGILAGSLVAGVGGYLTLRATSRTGGEGRVDPSP